MEKCMNVIGKYFWIQSEDECRNAMIHQILSNHHHGTFSKSKTKFEWLFLGFLLQAKLATCLKNFRSFEIVQYIGKIY